MAFKWVINIKKYNQALIQSYFEILSIRILFEFPYSAVPLYFADRLNYCIHEQLIYCYIWSFMHPCRVFH